MGGFIIKLLISIAVAFGTGQSQEIAVRIVMAVFIYSVISAWWYCCKMTENYIVGTIVFVAIAFFSSWGIAAGPNMVIKVIAYIVVIAIAIGGAIADIWGIIQAIRYRRLLSLFPPVDSASFCIVAGSHYYYFCLQDPDCNAVESTVTRN